MNKLQCYLVFITWISYVLSSGLFLFTDGFFLSRVERAERSECEPCADEACDSRQFFTNLERSANVCTKPKSRVVLLVIDALKYEFLEWRQDLQPDSSYHRNKMPIIRELMENHPNNTQLYKFMADPPTTTMQRLKGLTTGTLPTFIDVGANFASGSVEEDNIVEQVAKKHKGVVFMGDDTWTSMFPGKFLRQFPSSSFNVWDLDTADREVRHRIAFELKKNDWSLLVAHTLGVDHCGHKHGQRHPEMARKLGDADLLIREIVEFLQEDTTLIVVGDHGMTESGDHGGDSPNELQAGMFVFSKLPLSKLSGGSKTVNQIDLVPTISAILGIPMPFSNIGTLIADCLPVSRDEASNHRWYIAHSFWRNVAQAKKYIESYSEDSFLFDREKLKGLDELYQRILAESKNLKDDKSFDKFCANCRAYLKFIRDACAEIWIQFDAGLMSKGLVLVFCTLFFVYILVNGVSEVRMNKIMESHFLYFVVGTNFLTSLVTYALYHLGILEEFKNPNFFATGTASLGLLVILVMQNWDSISSTWYNDVKKRRINYLERGILLLTIAGLFSNSYIVEENRVHSYLLVSMVAVLTYTAMDSDRSQTDGQQQDKKSRNGKQFVNTRKLTILLILVGVIGCAAVRISSYFWRCREEQDSESCDNSLGKTGSPGNQGAERILLTVSLILLALYVTIVRNWLRNCGNLTGFSPSITVARYCPGVIVVCIGCYWVLEKLPKGAKLKLAISWQVNALPAIATVFVFFGLLVLYLKPLGVYLLPRRSDPISIHDGENIVPKLFDRVKQLFYTKKSDNEPQVPVVYGLGTVYSAAFISLSVFVTLLWALLLGNSFAPGTFMMFVTCTAILGILSIERFRNANSVVELLQVPSSVVLCWFLTAEYFFYATGHQATFPTIHWDAAFIGTGGYLYGNVLPAIFLGVNTFGCHIIAALTLPLLAIAPFSVHVMIPEIAKLKFRVDDDMKKGELVLFERETNFHSSLFSIYGKYILLHGLRIFGCMLSATIHCRHLMAWKIFAPKLIFEGLSFLVTLGSVFASIIMVLRIDRQVDNLISRVATKTR